MDSIKIAILGFGNVGKGVWRILEENRREISKRCGYSIEIARVLVREVEKPREISIERDILTDSFEEILNDDSIKLVVELTGDSHQARSYMLQAMRAKKHVVTANKLVLAKWGEELFKAAAEEGVHFYYEACVGGGIPIIREINEGLAANKIEQLAGIINGTTNYILTKMTAEGSSFEAALEEAQQKGYAEADPTSDIEGYDAVYKLSILAALAFDTKIEHGSIYREGICSISTIDIDYAKNFGYKIKLLAIAKDDNGRLELRVHPTLVPADHPIANVNDSFNAVFIKGNAVGDLMLYGRGAGDLPTGSAVVGDIISILRNNSKPIFHHSWQSHKEVKEETENESEYYIRLNIVDKPGVLGRIATTFGIHNVSIVSVTQDVKKEDMVHLVFTTHKSLERDIRNSLEKIKELESVNKVESILRIERFA